MRLALDLILGETLFIIFLNANDIGFEANVYATLTCFHNFHRTTNLEDDSPLYLNSSLNESITTTHYSAFHYSSFHRCPSLLIFSLLKRDLIIEID